MLGWYGIFAMAALVWSLILLRWLPQLSQCATSRVMAFGLSAFLISHVFLGYWFFHLEVGPIPPTIDRLLLGVLSIGFVLGLLKNFRMWFRFDWMDISVAVWFFVLSVSVATHDWRFRENLPLSRLIFFNVMPLVAYVIAKQNRFSIGQFRGILWTWVAIGTLLSLYGVAEWCGWNQVIFPKYIIDSPMQEFLGRARGPLLNPMINGILMSVGFGAAIVLTRTSPRGWLTVVLAGSVGLCLVGTFATLTRSVWLSAFGSLAILILASVNFRWRLRLILAGAVLIPLALFTAKDALNHFKRDRNVSASEMAESIKLRPILANVAYEMFCAHPVQGVGFGLYHKYKQPYHYTDKYEMPMQMGLDYTQHNVFLAYLVETGIVGVLALLWILWEVTRRSWLLLSNEYLSDDLRPFGLLGLVVVLSYVINGTFHDVSLIPMANCVLLVFCGLVGQVQSPNPLVTGETLSQFVSDWFSHGHRIPKQPLEDGSL